MESKNKNYEHFIATAEQVLGEIRSTLERPLKDGNDDLRYHQLDCLKVLQVILTRAKSGQMATLNERQIGEIVKYTHGLIHTGTLHRRLSPRIQKKPQVTDATHTTDHSEDLPF